MDVETGAKTGAKAGAKADVGAGAVPLVELWRGEMLESQHLGHAVISNGAGEVIEAWGNPAAMIYPRSSCKMVQAMPLLESGAGAGLSERQLALACASHQGAALHVEAVSRWLADLGLGESDLRCGVQDPADILERDRLICSGDAACQLHNNCSGKHAGFLTLNQHLGGGPEYIEPDHIVQRSIRQSFEEITGEDSPGYGIDGCSAPNFATSVAGLARAMSRFAAATEGDSRGRAMVRLREAMGKYPELVAGETRACTELMRAMNGQVAVKTGAEAVFVAILPEQNLGIALKVIDGGTRGAEAAITALLTRAGVLDAGNPAALKRLGGPLRNFNHREVAQMRVADGFAGA
ncbi:asparaginase [Pararhodobacter oceanensis]|uniref:L-asparaginase n=1 Tax=Pararhodobacter oceanensis TaxID=2172121 RepID=A0A2T8HYF6_9RHOB|nr:asparaginase [Pararhodobacter oceanensis]PVH30441.1 L-asparaginase [Pararhodobacter oceanensis]